MIYAHIQNNEVFSNYSVSELRLNLVMYLKSSLRIEFKQYSVIVRIYRT